MAVLLARRAASAALLLAAALQACKSTAKQVDLCSGVTCTAGACHSAGVCNPATGFCSAPAALADGTSCSDGNACNGDEVCTAGVCAAKPGTAVPCDRPPACHNADGASCAPATGECSYPAVADGTPCDDGNLCNGHEVCTAGFCAAKPGTAVTCNVPPACHTATGATCSAATGQCSYPNLAEDTACDDADLCNGHEVCTAGVCGSKPGTAVTCDSPPACHTATGATCNAATGQCSYPTLADDTACDDADLCNGHEVCTAGVCGSKPGTAVTCDSPPACHTATGATCNAATG